MNSKNKQLIIKYFKLTIVCFLLNFSFKIAYSYQLFLFYEYPLYDFSGQIVGYRTVRINSPQDLHPNNPWYSYLNLEIDSKHTIFSYANEIAKLLNKPLYLTISDRDTLSYSEKKNDYFNIKLCKHVNNYMTNNSKKFVFLHEIGHIAMLNAYPPYYNFYGLSYGDDNLHFVDEILPNYNTAWVEGWANAFAAQKNNGRVFNIDITKLENLGFLKNHTFEEMNRNELFVGKVIYDCITQISSGKSKVFNVLANRGPHYSLKDFIRSYINMYPEDQVAVANILNNNSFQKISLNELLDFVNNGSNVVSSSLYNFLLQNNKLKASAGNSNNTSNLSNQSIWNKIASWFNNLFSWFNKAFTTQSNQTSVSQPAIINEGTNQLLDSHVNLSSSFLPQINYNISNSNININSTAPLASYHLDSIPINISQISNELAKAYEEYQSALLEYSKLCVRHNTTEQQIKSAKSKVEKAKSKIKTLKKLLNYKE